jgi:peptidoglycan/LPS O-acetylase OafA/YrhL
MYRGRGFSWLERLCIALAFIAAALAAFGAFILVDHIPIRRDVLPGLAAILLFFSVAGLMLKGVDSMRNERMRQLIKDAEDNRNYPQNSN